jgi:glycerophosphoryl diester phosphodiesterase
MNIEIKNTIGQADFDQTRRIAGQVVEWIEANAARERVLVSSFDGIALKAVRDRDPGIHTGVLATIAVDPITAIEWAKRDGNFSVNLPLATVLGDASRIVEAARPVQVLVWTVNDPHAALTLADAGIGGVFSDDPGLIVAAFAQR